MRTDVQLISPYHSSLALNRGGFPEGSSCYHSDPIRYVVRGASHPVISATVARPRRDQQEHAGYSIYRISLHIVQSIMRHRVANNVPVTWRRMPYASVIIHVKVQFSTYFKKPPALAAQVHWAGYTMAIYLIPL